jgi:hypothetical protein
MIGPGFIPQLKGSLFSSFPFPICPFLPRLYGKLLAMKVTAESSSSYGQIPIKLVLRAMRGRSRLVNVPFDFIESNGDMGFQ